MSKNALVKFIILLVVVGVVYSVFWFFKAGQLQKQVNAFVTQNSNYVSVGEVSVSGFPLVQKITIKDLKFTFPGSLLSKRQVLVKQLDAKAGIFSSNFVVTLPEPLSLQDSDGNLANLEFNKEPEIKFSLLDGRLANFSYQDSGYKISDTEKNQIYASSSSAVNIESSFEADDKVKTKISVNIKDIEGFDVVDIYKNVFEKKISEGLKTGEIVLGSDVSSQPNSATAVVNSSDAASQAPQVTTDNSVNQAAAPVSQNIADASAQPADLSSGAPVKNQAPVSEADLAKAVVEAEVIKSNFVMEVEYSLIPNKDDQKAQIPTDPTQIQEVPSQHNRSIKITSAEFSNSAYKITLNGEVNLFADDNMPSGAVSVQIEKIDQLIARLAGALNNSDSQKAPLVSGEIQAMDLAENGTLSEDAYKNFLKKFIAALPQVSKEIAAKNPVSKDEIAQFDIRREKNLEFLVNEASIREIFGKF